MANPPPFFRLNMTNGSGKGSISADQTPIDILQEGYDQGYLAGEAGGGRDVLSAAADFAWGETYGTERVMTVTGDGSGQIASGSLQHIGDDDGWLITKVDGVVVTWGSGPTGEWLPSVDGNFFFAMNEGGSKTFTYLPVYTDGTAKSMDINLLAGDATIDDTVPASATVGDALLGAATGVALGVFQAGSLGLDAGPLIADQVVLEDILGTENDVVFEGDYGYFTTLSIVSSGLTTPSLSKAVRMTSTNTLYHLSTLANCAIIDGMSTVYNSGMIFFRIVDGMEAGSATFSIMAMHGSTTVSADGTKIEFSEFNNALAAHGIHWSGRVASQTVVEFGAGVVDSTGIWYSFAWTETAGGNIKQWLSKVGEAFGGVGSNESAKGSYDYVNDGLVLFNRWWATTVFVPGVEFDIAAVIPVVPKDSDVGLEAIHDAA